MVLLPSQIEVTTATCSSIDVVVPWTHLYSKPIILRLGEVFVEAHDLTEPRKEDKKKPKKPKKKTSRELLDTILVELTVFKLKLKLGPTELLLVINEGETYFADSAFNKVSQIPKEVPIENVISSYRFLQVHSLDLELTTGERKVILCHHLEVVGRYTTQREADTYKLLDTLCVVELSKISLNLLMDDYINMISYFKSLFAIATESAILDVVNSEKDGSAAPTTPHSEMISGMNSDVSSESHTPTLEHSSDVEFTKSTPMSPMPTLSRKITTKETGEKSKTGSSLRVELVGDKNGKVPVLCSNTKSDSFSPKDEKKALKQKEKELKKEEKKLCKLEKKGEPKTTFVIVLTFLKMSLQNETTDEGLCWLVENTEIKFVPAYGGRIKRGIYGFSIGSVEGLYMSKGDVKRLIWGLDSESCHVEKTKNKKEVVNCELTTTWERNVLVHTRIGCLLNKLGLTMEFEMFKKLLNFLK
ncbi:hypothetical protein EIN_015480 [Entamoeba invadens IP1]|uniref:hypothetical protein n=1 Tax=Entamoeba invadens IP1 TaxID=370355 RepID=UPI0002C3F100|nr:hypothetical protein EIN_015480 [Entamoeba invadens IP1]ELP90389.1 hypothetical protein EIN_015480 [Entamoeba invadens IP1]|eukprot:XP_004257160.1 hypothetical protein EIN_015480 [Entamoeba invadens IP1]